MLVENEPVDTQSTDEIDAANGQVTEDAKNEALVTETEVASETETEKTKESKPTPQRDRPQKRQRDSGMSQVISWFAACGRCSFFLAGCKLTCGQEVLETAVSQRSDQWLTVPWSHALAGLVHKSYGSRVDIGCYHYEGCCSECRRHFIFQSAEEPGDPATFRIEWASRRVGEWVSG